MTKFAFERKSAAADIKVERWIQGVAGAAISPRPEIKGADLTTQHI